MAFLKDLIYGLIKAFGGNSKPDEQSPYPQGHSQQQQTLISGYPPVQQQQRPSYPSQASYGKHNKPDHQNSQGHHPQQQHQQPHVGSPPHKLQQYQGQDPNQINQHDEYYTNLRAQANREGDAMAKCFEQSHEAHSRGDGATAKQLSNQGKEHQHKMESLNKQASDWIFAKNNEDSKPGEVDLHGLYVKEAISRTDEAIQQAKQRGDTDIHLIVGKGLHSPGGQAKIKPAIEELIQKHQLIPEIDPHNAGVLIVHLDGQGGGMGTDEVTRRLERRNEDCIIM